MSPRVRVSHWRGLPLGKTDALNFGYVMGLSSKRITKSENVRGYKITSRLGFVGKQKRDGDQPSLFIVKVVGNFFARTASYLTTPNSARRLSAQAFSLLAGSAGISLPKLTV